MKKIFFLVAVLITSITFGQNTFPFPSSGNVGIGTTTPLTKLHIDVASSTGISGDNGIRIATGLMGLNLGTESTNNYSWIQSSLGGVGSKNLALNPYGGNVGIGTATPSVKLDVKGTIKSYETTPLGTNINSFQLINEKGGSVGNNIMNRVWFFRDATLNNWLSARLHDGISVDASFGTPHVDTRTWWERDPYDNIQSWGNAGSTYLTIKAGNVGIGTTNPDNILTVNGTIHATEVKVTSTVPVPDYVFANDYKLKTLQEVEEYIKANCHLPEIPSAKEIEKNGLLLAEMNMNLLKKVEEMTLYLIEQNKISQELMKKVELLETSIQSIKK